ncbi:nitroreductase family protein [Nonlabens xiamenensis]|uniref:nitroreductase family protein n=1 Tax=Nonlabens xiamenensis TaxID=2341043 RepID=UPI000F611155|nr:nitroreductase family protein [Nonlabens xiamenensis]
MSTTETIIKKDTPTDHKILDVIKNRWSPRTFSEQPISHEELQILFEAGRWAPSSNNLQPWHIVWGVKGSDTYDRIMECLMEFNQNWAKNAPVLLLGVIHTKTPKGDDNYHAPHDLGQFAANMAIQAQSMGIAMHQMAGINYEEAKKEFEFPEDFHVATAIALGYYGGSLEDVPEDLRDAEEGPRKRKPQEDFVFNGNYRETAELEK